MVLGRLRFDSDRSCSVHPSSLRCFLSLGRLAVRYQSAEQTAEPRSGTRRVVALWVEVVSSPPHPQGQGRGSAEATRTRQARANHYSLLTLYSIPWVTRKAVDLTPTDTLHVHEKNFKIQMAFPTNLSMLIATLP